MSAAVRPRADACPGVFAPHDAADGALARVRLPGGVISAAALRVVASCADELGDGHVHLTSRGNLQLRGLARGPELAARLAAAGLLPSATHERVRNVLASPLSGIAGGLADVRGVAAGLDRGLCARSELAALPGRFLFALDDGRGDVAAEDPDLCWRAVSPSNGVLLVAGVAVAEVAVEDAVAVLLDAARAFLIVRAADGGTAWRAAELPDGPQRIVAALRPKWRIRPTPTVGGVRAPAAPSHDPDPRASVAVQPAVNARASRSRDGDRDPRVLTADPAALDTRGPRSTSGDPHGRVPAVEATARPVRGARSSDGDRDPRAAAATPVALETRGSGSPAAGTPGPVRRDDGGLALVVAPVLGELTAEQLRLLADVASTAIVTPWRTIVLADPVPPIAAGPHKRDTRPEGDDGPATRERRVVAVHGHPNSNSAPLGRHAPGTTGARPAHSPTPGPDPAPDRTVPAAAARLADAGLLVAPAPAADVSACAGRPGCAKALADVRADARAALGSLPAGRVHVSGCARRCGAPRAPHVDAVALELGGYLVDGIPSADLASRTDPAPANAGADPARPVTAARSVCADAARPVAAVRAPSAGARP